MASHSVTQSPDSGIAASTALVLRGADLESTDLFTDSPASEASVWMGRLCRLDIQRSELSSCWPARWKATPIVGRVAARFDGMSGVVEELTKLIPQWRAQVGLLSESAPSLIKVNACALRMMVGKTVVAMDRLSRIEELESKTVVQLRDASRALRENFSLSSSYEQVVAWFQPFSDLLKADRSSELLLEFTSEGLKLNSFRISSAVLRPSEEVPTALQSLRVLLSGVSGPAAIEAMHDVELIALYTLFNRLSLNYIVHQGLKIDFLPQILFECEGVRVILQKALEARHESHPAEFRKIWEGSSAIYHELQSLRAEAESIPGYPRGFLTHSVHAEVLNQLAHDNLEVYRQVFVRAAVSIDGISFVDADDDVGLRIYKLAAQEATATRPASKERLVVAVETRALETFSTHYTPSQSKDPVFHVMGHAPVFEIAKPLYARFKELMTSLASSGTAGMEGIDMLPITTLGFGLNGAAAQLLAFQWAKEHAASFEHPKDGHLCLGLGVPYYLERESAFSVGQQSGLYSLNFANEADDTCLKASVLSAAVSAPYGGSNFNTYPLVDKISGVTLNITGHHLSDYAYNLPGAVQKAKSFYDHMAQLRSMEDKSRAGPTGFPPRLASLSGAASAGAEGKTDD